MGAERLLAFAAGFIGDISHHRDVRTEQLAEAFRRAFGLSHFPRYSDLLRACRDAGIVIESLLATASIEGTNGWAENGPPIIRLRAGLSSARAETTLCHELREVLENAFQRVKPAYVGIDTHHNQAMNPESDQFAGYLLMHTEAARDLLTTNGFDFAAFARGTQRSIASVVTHAQSLFPAGFAGTAPVAGLWLYEAPWSPSVDATVTLVSFSVTQVAHLMGFSTRKSRRASAMATAFPERWSGDEAAEVVREALASRSAAARIVGGFDLFGDGDFTVVAEPLFARAAVRQVLLTAVRKDGLPLVGPWLNRLDLPEPVGAFQHV